jgi:serine/threonine protein phosphatase 1
MGQAPANDRIAVTMLNRLFRRRPDPAPARIASVPAGQRVYAIGDIHGRDDLFAALIDRIVADDAARGPADTTLILLGDLVDRGPASAQVVERAMGLRNGPFRLRWLIGNHEEVFLKALGRDPALVRYFVRIGGAPTIHSYGISGADYDRLTFDELAEELPRHVPKEHIAFLAAGDDMVAIGGYLFVHAGVKPGFGFDDQRPSDLRWIREDFLDDMRDHGAVIVHGHTISDDVEDRGNRIGIDTGAYASGVLTAIGLEGTERWYLRG